MLSPVLAVLVGLALLTYGADRFIVGAAASARNFGVSPLIIGLTIVGFGTSAPEMLVSAVAAFQGNTALSIGNALGSNITNIALVLGITALLRPLAVDSGILRREFPMMLAAMLLGLLLMVDGWLGRLDGFILLGGVGVMLFILLRVARTPGPPDPLISEYEREIPPPMATPRALALLAAGLVLLLVSSRMLVWGAVQIALALGVSELVVGLTVVAVGTSLPELAASVVSALKGEAEIAIGNVIGSNMFNMLGVLGLPGAIHPGPFASEVLTRDYPIMIGLAVTMLVMAYGFRGRGRINRREAAILLLIFGAYQWILYLYEAA